MTWPSISATGWPRLPRRCPRWPNSTGSRPHWPPTGLDPAVRDQIARPAPEAARRLASRPRQTESSTLLEEASDEEMFAFIDNELGL